MALLDAIVQPEDIRALPSAMQRKCQAEGNNANDVIRLCRNESQRVDLRLLTDRGWFVEFIQAVSSANRIVPAPHVIVILNRGRVVELPLMRALRPWPDELHGLAAQQDSVCR